MNGIKFIEPTQKMEFEQKEYLLANYDIADKLFSSKEIPNFAFDFALESNSTVWLQTLDINTDTQTFTFVDYVELNNSKLRSNYFEAYTHSTEILKGLYRIVFKNDVSEIYKVSYNLLNYYQFVIQKMFFQELFTENIDFETNIAPDNIGGNDASLSGSNAVRIKANTSVPAIIYPHSKFDVNSDFTFIIKINLSGNNLQLYFLTSQTESNFTFYIYYLGIIDVRINSTNYRYHGANLPSGVQTVILRRIGNDWSVFVGDVNYLNFTNSSIIKNTELTTKIAPGNNSGHNIYDIAFIKRGLSDIEIEMLGKSSRNIMSKAVTEAPNSYYFSGSEGVGDILYDIINGDTANYNSGAHSYVRVYNKPFYNLEFGFDLYIPLDVSLPNLYVPLKYDGTSLGKVISGYTFVETVTQNGNEFLNCETKILQPNVQELKDLDTYNLYFDILGDPIEVDFETLHNYSQGNVIMTKTDNKITNLKLKLKNNGSIYRN